MEWILEGWAGGALSAGLELPSLPARDSSGKTQNLVSWPLLEQLPLEEQPWMCLEERGTGVLDNLVRIQQKNTSVKRSKKWDGKRQKQRSASRNENGIYCWLQRMMNERICLLAQEHIVEKQNKRNGIRAWCVTNQRGDTKRIPLAKYWASKLLLEGSENFKEVFCLVLGVFLLCGYL